MKGPTGLEPLFPDRDSDEPLVRQFARKLRHAIETGVYRPASRLLPSRELAIRLGLSRNTVTAAIEQLTAEGYLEARPGSGTFVAEKITAQAVVEAPLEKRIPAAANALLAVRPLYQRDDRAALVRTERGREVARLGPLRAGIPDLGQFPHAAWARVTRRTLARFGDYLSYGEAIGELALREAIAQHVGQFRGITATPEQVIIVAGTQGAISLAATVLVREGDPVLIEDPCYWMARATFEARSTRLRPVDVDNDGMRTGEAPSARAAYVSPSHQYPLGTVMSVERRRLLLQWANDNDAYIIEDDYDSEYAFDAKPLPPLQSIDRNGRVIYVSSFSKTLAPGMRIGYIIVPPHLAESFTIARLVATLGGNRYVEATLAGFITDGHFARHVRRMTRVYAERRRALIDTLAAGLPSGFSIAAGNAGLHVALVGPPDFDDVAARAAAGDEGVSIEALSTYCIRRTDCRGLVLGFSAAPPAETAAAARIVLSVLS